MGSDDGYYDPNDDDHISNDGQSFAFVKDDVVEDDDGRDPWDEVREGAHSVSATTNPLKIHRETVHYVIEGSAENAPPDAPRSCYMLSQLGWRKDTQLVRICTTTGELQFRGVQGVDVFRSEGEARAHLTVNLGLRIVNLAKGLALLGCVAGGAKLLVGVVTNQETRATLPSGDPIFTAADVKWATVKLGYPSGSKKAESFAKLINDFQIANLHYYTQPFVDITRPYPSAETTPDPAFVWNQHLIDPFAAVGLQDWCIRLVQGVAVGSSNVSLNCGGPDPEVRRRMKRYYKKYNPSKLADVPAVLAKYEGQEAVMFDKMRKKYGEEPDESEFPDDSDDEKPTDANVVLLTRRWCRHPGTRYNARGIDLTGAPANELECEILLSRGNKWSSYIWRRGSVPIRWTSELGGNAVKVGQATFVVLDKPYDVSHKYYDDLASRFAGWGVDNKAPPVSLYSLLHGNPEHGEYLLVDNFRKSLKTVAKNRPRSRLALHDFDWHGTVKLNGLPDTVNEFWKLMSAELETSRSSCGTVEKQGVAARNVVTVHSPLTGEKKKEKVGVFGVMRGLVSQKKLRLQEDGFDLDLTYITPRLIAMGFPSYGAEGFYRNPADEVERFFETRHKGHYRIINLCTERDYDNDGRFRGNYLRYPFDDHNAPTPISLLTQFVSDAKAYLAEDPKNVLSIHCKAGKGRTGVMISAMLMAGAEPGLVPPNSAPAALGFFGAQRTKDGHGVTIPSQRRYIQYYEEMLLKHGGVPPPEVPIRISKIVIQSPIKTGSAPHVYVQVHEVAKWIYPDPPKLGKQFFSRDTPKEKFDSRNDGPAKQASRFTIFNCEEGSKDGKGPVVRGDVKVTFMAENKIKFLKRADEHLFHFGFHTSFIDMEKVRNKVPLRLTKAELDKACKDEKHKEFRRDLLVEVYFQEVSPEEEAALQERLGNRSMSPTSGGGRQAPPQSPVSQKPGAQQAEDEAEDDEDDVAEEREGDVTTTVEERQRGIMRLNCVDSLDRTNLASFFMGLQIVAELKRSLRNDPGRPFPLMGRTLQEVRAALGEDLVGILAEAFVANGDVCSLLYTNTPATHTEAVREMSPRLGKAQSNAMLSVKRRYENTIKDNVRHNGFFAFLGKLRAPNMPPSLLSVEPSCIVSSVPCLKTNDTNIDPTVLLHGNIESGAPWMVPSTAGDVELLVSMPPTPVEVTQVALQFRCDPSTGDDEVFPQKIEVSCGTSLDKMEKVLGPISIPRTADFTWLVYNLYPRGPVGTTLLRVKCCETLGNFMTLGGVRVFGPRFRASAQPFLIPHAPRVGFNILSLEGDVTTVVLSEPARLQAVYLKCKSDDVKVMAGAGENMTELQKSSDGSVLKFTSPNADVAPGSPRGAPSQVLPDRILKIHAPSTVEVVQVQALATPPCVHKVPKPAAALPSKKTTMKTRRKAKPIAVLTDDTAPGVAIAVLPESNIAGVRLTTAGAEQQAASVMVSVADAPTKEFTFKSTRSARPQHLEGLVVPICAEGANLDYHFRKTTKGTIVKFEVQAPPDVDLSKLLPAAKVHCLVDEHA